LQAGVVPKATMAAGRKGRDHRAATGQPGVLSGRPIRRKSERRIETQVDPKVVRRLVPDARARPGAGACDHCRPEVGLRERWPLAEGRGNGAVTGRPGTRRTDLRTSRPRVPWSRSCGALVEPLSETAEVWTSSRRIPRPLFGAGWRPPPDTTRPKMNSGGSISQPPAGRLSWRSVLRCRSRAVREGQPTLTSGGLDTATQACTSIVDRLCLLSPALPSRLPLDLLDGRPRCLEDQSAPEASRAIYLHIST
jgi:hypothetical protein